MLWYSVPKITILLTLHKSINLKFGITRTKTTVKLTTSHTIICILDMEGCSFMMNDDNLILHNLHFITAHLCSDYPLFYALVVLVVHTK